MFDSLLIMLFVFRLVAAPRAQGYRATLCELWEQCAAAGIELPQDEPPAASTACEAREKLDEAAFRRVHRDILAHSPDGALWTGLSHAERIGAILALSGMISWVFALLRPLLLWRAARITS